MVITDLFGLFVLWWPASHGSSRFMVYFIIYFILLIFDRHLGMPIHITYYCSILVCCILLPYKYKV